MSGGQLEVFVRRENGQYDRYNGDKHATGRQLFVQGQCCGTVDTVPLHSIPAEMGTQRRNGRRPVYF
jgi:hypothetical protein